MSNSYAKENLRKFFTNSRYESMSRPVKITARFDGTCCKCGGGYSKGAVIVRVLLKGWAHSKCSATS